MNRRGFLTRCAAGIAGALFGGCGGGSVHMSYYNCARRFIIAPAGRRSYKTEIAKRKGVRRAMFSRRQNALFMFAAPIRQQAKDIFWQDLLDMVPHDLRYDRRDTELSFKLKHNDAKLQVVGMDKPMRVEGKIIDGIVLDEFGNMKETAWKEHVLPSLSNLVTVRAVADDGVEVWPCQS